MAISTRPDKFSAAGVGLPNPIQYYLNSLGASTTVAIKDDSGTTIATLSYRVVGGDITIDVRIVLLKLFTESDLKYVSINANSVTYTDSKVIRKYYIDTDSSNKRYVVFASLQSVDANFDDHVINTALLISDMTDFAGEDFGYGDFG